MNSGFVPHLNEDKGVVVTGYLGRGVARGERPAAFNGGRLPTLYDKLMGIVCMMLPVIYTRLPEPSLEKPFNALLTDIGSYSVWRCASCEYEGRAIAKWGGVPDSQDMIIFDPEEMELVGDRRLTIDGKSTSNTLIVLIAGSNAAEVTKKLGALVLPVTRHKLKSYREEIELRTQMSADANPVRKYTAISMGCKN